MGKFNNLEGKIFGRLTVTADYKVECKKTLWRCICSCGGEKWIRSDGLKSGSSTSCGMCEGNESIGRTYGSLTVLERLSKNESGSYIFNTQCICGNFHKTTLGHLKDGHVTKCKECSRKYPTHEHHKTLYKRWTSMRDRCYKKEHKSYKDYGARGVAICEQWLNDYMSFRNWALENGFEDHLELDRINTDGNYEPNNCRWITKTENANNKRRSIKVEGKSIREIGEIYGVKYSTLWTRYKRIINNLPNKTVTIKDLIC